MIDDDTLDSAEVAPLFSALRSSSGDARAAILEALVRLPLAPADVRKLPVPAPVQAPPLRSPWVEGEPPGFTMYSPSAAARATGRSLNLSARTRSALTDTISALTR